MAMPLWMIIKGAKIVLAEGKKGLGEDKDTVSM